MATIQPMELTVTVRQDTGAVECRGFTPRAAVLRADGEKRHIEGVGIVFYDGTPETEYRLWGNVVERIKPEAVEKALARSDADPYALFNHDPDVVLGRVRAGTLRLEQKPDGLFYSAAPPDTNGARDALTLIERGEVTGSSFGFFPVAGGTEITEDDDGREVIWITDMRLRDVGPVTFPAYRGTTATARAELSAPARDELEASLAAFRAAGEQARRRRSRRMREMEIRFRELGRA